MQKYFNSVTNRAGLAMNNVLVTVTTLAGAPAVLYSGNGVNIRTLPLLTDANGYYEFYAADGRYTIKLTGASITSITITDVLIEDPEDEVKLTDLAASTGAGLVGVTATGSGSVLRTVASKLGDLISVRDKGAVVNGSTDDSAAIAAARANVQAQGGTVIYGGKASASGFWENLSALAMEWVRGSAAAYAIDMVSSKPLIALKIFQGTPTAGPGFAAYGARYDGYTQAGVNVASTVLSMCSLQSYSTNTGGIATDNDTNQVAAVFNASAMDASSSASVTAINVIGASLYTGASTHTLNPFQINIVPGRAPGWFGEAGKTYSATSTIVNVGTFDATYALGIDTSTAGIGFLHGAVISGVKNTGITIARSTVTPNTGLWVSAASTYGVYVGARPLYQLNPGQIPAFDAVHNPAIGVCLGNRAATSGTSNTLRFESTDASSVTHVTDISTNVSNAVTFSFDGTTNFIVAPSGAVLIQGNQVLTGRQTVTGSRASGAALDSLLVALATHGLITNSTSA